MHEWMHDKLLKDQLTLAEFWHVHAAWSQATFGSDAERGPLGALKHLAKEVQEVLADPTDLEEYADCIFLVFDACRRAGFTYEQLRVMLNRKMLVNMKRQWAKGAADEPSEHVREGA